MTFLDTLASGVSMNDTFESAPDRPDDISGLGEADSYHPADVDEDRPY